MRRFLITGLFCILAFTAPSVSVAGNPDAGAIKANTCMGCHGSKEYSNVYPSYRVPMLGGQSEQYLVAALKAYRAGQRSHPTMKAQAASMTDEDIADMAAYFANVSK